MTIKDNSQIYTIARRPIDCSSGMIDTFIDLVAAGEETKKEVLLQKLKGAEHLFFTGDGKTIMGVAAIRYQRTDYHKFLFNKAGVPEMFNPDSIESCWISVGVAYRGMGVFKNQFDFKTQFLNGRPSHSTRRVGNELIQSATKKEQVVQQAGHIYDSPHGDYQSRLIVQNHDPVYDPGKKFQYGRRS